MNDKITICLFSRETPDGFDSRIFNEKDNLLKIYDQFSAAAVAHDREPPVFVISLLLIPDWDEGSSYKKSAYLAKKNGFMNAAAHFFSVRDFQIQDFYAGLFSNECKYLVSVSEGSNCIDMMKIKAVIENLDSRHLQLDSNLIITDFDALYVQTFSEAGPQCDAMNASFYGTTFVTPHSKIIYTHPTGRVGHALADTYAIELRKNDEDKKNRKSNFYLRVFVNALRTIGLAVDQHPPIPRAILQDAEGVAASEYRITACLLTVTTQSWANGPVPDYVDLPLPEIRVGDIHCTANVIQSVIRKHVMKKVPGEAHAQLLAISNIDFEVSLIREYYARCNPEEQHCIASLLPSTPLGKSFCRAVFSMELAALWTMHGIQDISQRSSIVRTAASSQENPGSGEAPVHAAGDQNVAVGLRALNQRRSTGRERETRAIRQFLALNLAVGQVLKNPKRDVLV